MNRTVGLPALITPLEKLFSVEFRTMSVIQGNLSPVLVGTSFTSEARIQLGFSLLWGARSGHVKGSLPGVTAPECM